MDLRPRRLLHTEGKDAREILSHVKDLLSRRRVNQLHRFDVLMGYYRKTSSGLQPALRRVADRGFLRRKFRRGSVDLLPVIEVGEHDSASGYRPALIGSDHFLGAVCIGQYHIRDDLPLISVIALVLEGGKSEAALVPAVAQQDRQFSSSGDLIGNIVGLILHPAVVVVGVGSQILIPHLLPVDVGFIKSQSGHIEAGLRHLLRRGDLLTENRMALFRAVAGQPLSGPLLAHLRGLEPLHFAVGFLPRVGEHCHLPEIAGSGLQRKLHRIGQGIRLFIHAGVKQDLLHLLVRGNPYSRRLLRLPPGLVHLPGKGNAVHEKAHGVGHMIYLRVINSHLFILLIFNV